MGPPKTKFSLELKIKSKNWDYLKSLKKVFVKTLTIPNNIINELLEDYFRERKKVLSEKDCWLIYSSNEFLLMNKIECNDIEQIERDFSSSDLLFKVKSDTFKNIRIRWQNTVGIANISVQCT